MIIIITAKICIMQIMSNAKYLLNSKKTGSYYTPSVLADFLISHLLNNYVESSSVRILEPSCGDGQFLHSLLTAKDAENLKIDLELVEISLVELKKAAQICQSFKGVKKLNLVNTDFLSFQKTNQHKFSLIVGNPPYIKKNYLSQKQIEACREIYDRSGLKIDEVKNIWPAFLLSSIEFLDDSGVLCFVLPAELLQVNYAKALRRHILTSFERIEIFAFNELIFPDIEQDVVVLLGAKKAKKNGVKGISFYQVEKLDDLKEPLYTKKHSNTHRETLDKWTNYILSDEELSFIDAQKNGLSNIKDYCSKAEVGIVTAANDYFIVKNDVVTKYNLEEYIKPILARSNHIHGKIEFTKKDLNRCNSTNCAVNLIAFENVAQCALKKSARVYVEKGREQKLHERYKFKKRSHWHHVPSIWAPEGFFTKRSHLFPRIIINKAKVQVTDSFYRVNMKAGKQIVNLAFSFCNTLTFILCELEGRYYGGGVLELTPNEFKNIRVPYMEYVTNEQYIKLAHLFEIGADIDEILDYSDNIVLKEGLALNQESIHRLRVIYRKLVNRRLKQANK